MAAPIFLQFIYFFISIYTYLFENACLWVYTYMYIYVQHYLNNTIPCDPNVLLYTIWIYSSYKLMQVFGFFSIFFFQCYLWIRYFFFYTNELARRWLTRRLIAIFRAGNREVDREIKRLRCADGLLEKTLVLVEL